jgi:hypothetical protein
MSGNLVSRIKIKNMSLSRVESVVYNPKATHPLIGLSMDGILESDLGGFKCESIKYL